MALSRLPDSRGLLLVAFAGMFFSLPVATSPTVICGVVALSLWVFSGKFIGDIIRWLHSPLAVPVLILIALHWIGLFSTLLPVEGFRLAQKTHYWLYTIALGAVLIGRKDSELALKMFLAGMSCNSALSILQYAGIAPLKKGLSVGLFGGSSPYIAYSLLLVVGIMISSIFFCKASSWKGRLLCGLLMLQFFLTVGFIGGRSGYVALIILFPFIVYNLIGQRHILKIVIISLAAIALLFTFSQTRSRFAKISEDLQLYAQGDVNTAIGLRFHMWEIALSEIKEHPLTGIGTGGFQRSWELRKKDPALPFFDHPHNSFLSMAVSFGLPGLAAFCWILWVMLKRGWRRRNAADGFSVFAFTAVFIIGSLTDTQIIPFATAMAFSLFAGLSEAVDAV